MSSDSRPQGPAPPAPPACRSIIVTGGGRGLGWEMAEALVAAGHRVLITGAREPAELQAAAARLNTQAGQARALAMVADVANWSDCEAVAARCLSAWGRIDGLVNNAGRGMLEISGDFVRKPALFWQADPQGFRNIVDANVTGAFLMARACVPVMVAQGFGRVVNVSTSRPTMVRTGYCPYGPSKAALEAMSVVWAKDLQGSGVTAETLSHWVRVLRCLGHMERAARLAGNALKMHPGHVMLESESQTLSSILAAKSAGAGA